VEIDEEKQSGAGLEGQSILSEWCNLGATARSGVSVVPILDTHDTS